MFSIYEGYLNVFPMSHIDLSFECMPEADYCILFALNVLACAKIGELLHTKKVKKKWIA